MTTQRERVTGYRDALQVAGLPFDDEPGVRGDADAGGGCGSDPAALASGPRPSAAFSYNDIVAMGAARALTLRGIKVGRDFALIGFDDIVEAEHNAPPLTTVNADTRDMGARAAESLLGIIARRGCRSMSFIGDTRLVIRESCGAMQGMATSGRRCDAL